MPTEQQPEEAATKVPAAAASAAGSYVQTQMYGRGFRQRPDSTVEEPNPSRAQETTETPRPSPPPASVPDQEPAGSGEAPQPPTASASPLDRLTRSLDDPDLYAEILAGGPAADAAEQAVAAQLDEPAVSGEMLVACSEQDAAAARARLVQGQQVEPPPVALPVPGLAPGL